MSSQITLIFKEGSLQGKEVVLDHPGRYVLGRAGDCDIHLPKREGSSGVSRHHCVLEFNPPLLRVRDLGSLNGTYVNGANIGQRYRSDLLDNDDLDHYAERELSEGDLLQVYDTVLRVSIGSSSDKTEAARSR